MNGLLYKLQPHLKEFSIYSHTCKWFVIIIEEFNLKKFIKAWTQSPWQHC